MTFVEIWFYTECALPVLAVIAMFASIFEE
jgi:hypothetical protein